MSPRYLQNISCECQVVKYMVNVGVSAKIQKTYACAKNSISNPSTFICKNGEYLASTIVDSVITCHEIIDAADSVSTNISCTVPMNAANVATTNGDGKRFKMDCYILHSFISAHITIYNHYFLLSLQKT